MGRDRFPGAMGLERSAGGSVRLAGLLSAGEYLVDQIVVASLIGRHEVVAIGVALELLEALAGVMRQDAVETLAQLDDLFGVDLDVRGLALEAAQRLVDHDARVRQRVALALGPA